MSELLMSRPPCQALPLHNPIPLVCPTWTHAGRRFAHKLPFLRRKVEANPNLIARQIMEVYPLLQGEEYSTNFDFVNSFFQIIAFDELKTDYKNPIDQCNSLNPVSFIGLCSLGE